MNIHDATEQAYKNGYDRGTKAALKKGEWRDAQLELPPENPDKHYIIYGEYPTYIVMIFGGEIPTVAQYDGEDWLFDDGEAYRVTHWQPLPAPPCE